MSKTAKEYRISMGADVLITMMAQDEFPFGNIRRVSKVMQEYFISEGFEDALMSSGYKWQPDADYWVRHLKEIREHLRKKKKLFLEYIRYDGSFEGEWQFLKKGEYENVMHREKAGLDTRIRTYNWKLDDGLRRWKLDIPRIGEAFPEEKAQ